MYHSGEERIKTFWGLQKTEHVGGEAVGDISGFGRGHDTALLPTVRRIFSSSARVLFTDPSSRDLARNDSVRSSACLERIHISPR